MLQTERRYEASLTTIERQVDRLETLAQKIEDEGHQAIVLDCVAAVRREMKGIRDQTQLQVAWG
jgi:hypothetical protein